MAVILGIGIEYGGLRDMGRIWFLLFSTFIKTTLQYQILFILLVNIREDGSIKFEHTRIKTQLKEEPESSVNPLQFLTHFSFTLCTGRIKF